MTQDQKDMVDRYIQIYLDGIQSVSNDAGWECASLMGKVIDFAGDMPPPSGNDQSNLSMINAIQLLRNRHAKWPIIAGSVTNMLRSHEERRQIMALLARHFYTGHCPKTGKAWTDGQRAQEVGQDPRAFRYNLLQGYPSMIRHLEAAKIYCEFMGMTS